MLKETEKILFKKTFIYSSFILSGLTEILGLSDLQTSRSSGIHDLWQNTVEVEGRESLLKVRPKLWMIFHSLHVILCGRPEEEDTLLSAMD